VPNKGIKGITVEIAGDTTNLQKALQDVNTASRNLTAELKDVDRLLKLDPSNVTLLKQKQDLLTESISKTREKLERLQAAEADVQRQFKEGKISEEQYRAFQRELEKTRGELNSLEKSAESNVNALEDLGNEEESAAKSSADLSKELDKSGDSAEVSGGKFKTFVGVLKGIGAVMGATVTAAAGVGVGLFKMAEGAANSAKEISNTSQKLGLSKQGFQEWDYILRKSGTSIDVMGAGMKTLQKTMGGLTEDGDSASKAFKAVGIEFDEIKGKSPEEALNITIKALQNMPAGADRSAAAMKLFGKAGMELQPLLNKTSEETEELRCLW